MSKLTGQQREYFETRIKESFNISLGPMEKKIASEKLEYAKDNFSEFLHSLGLKKDYDRLCVLQGELDGLSADLKSRIDDIRRTYNKDYDNNWAGYNIVTPEFHKIHSELMSLCKMESEIAQKATPLGVEIEKLRTKEKEALDYIYGYNQSQELMDGLKHILTGTSVAMLEEYNAG